ncbi:hypothetical protein CBR_g46734 [Chara braunii]|uniref:CCHC-type domain-containing protein n=1 Tax=Chara braunii TaxID=69332 RepID=A0A388K3Z2_CHABU|nr:hypothetical protein CBR_g46734 [Chara braunii]|eukprot:GBG64778.1 hypothetical protein CBR_g46734 [Chara braunii]
MESLRRLTLRIEQRVMSLEQGQRTHVPTGPVGERASGGSYSATERTRVFRETEPWTLGLGVTRQDSWAEGSMGVRPVSEGETSTVDKFMLATCEVAPVGQGQVRTMDQTPPLELGVREGVVEPRDGILRDGAQDPYVTPFGTLPTAASPSPDVMEEVARGLAQRSAAQDGRRTTEGSARVLSPDEVDRAIKEVTTRLESTQTQASPALKRAKVGEESARDRCSWCGRGGHHRGDCPAFQHDLDRGIVQFDAQGRLMDMHHARIRQGRHDMLNQYGGLRNVDIGMGTVEESPMEVFIWMGARRGVTHVFCEAGVR